MDLEVEEIQDQEPSAIRDFMTEGQKGKGAMLYLV